MKLYEIHDWVGVHFVDRTILRRDLPYICAADRNNLLYNFEVEPIPHRSGHYKVAKLAIDNIADVQKGSAEYAGV